MVVVEDVFEGFVGVEDLFIDVLDEDVDDVGVD